VHHLWKHDMKTEMSEDAGGTKRWKTDNGAYHRTDGPAIEYANGSEQWYVNGLRHRTDGPACEYADGSKTWWVNGLLHRTDGPAIAMAMNDWWWYLNGEGHKFDQWLDANSYLTDDEKVMMKLQYG
jgi:hypothetical protein